MSALNTNILFAFLLGACLGLAGAAPLFIMLYRAVAAKRGQGSVPSIQAGFGAVVLSALIVMAEIALAYFYVPACFFEISVTAVLVMLVAVFIAGLAAWRALEAARRKHP